MVSLSPEHNGDPIGKYGPPAEVFEAENLLFAVEIVSVILSNTMFAEVTYYSRN